MHKKRKMFFMLMVLSLLLCGCGDHELENRSFPLAVGLESEKQGCRVVFNFPVLSEVANENADGSYTAVASKKGKDFFTRPAQTAIPSFSHQMHNLLPLGRETKRTPLSFLCGGGEGYAYRGRADYMVK